MTIKLNIFTNAEGMSENIKFDGHEMKYISFINRKWQFFCLFPAFVTISTILQEWSKNEFPRAEPQFSAGDVARSSRHIFDVINNFRELIRAFPLKR